MLTIQQIEEKAFDKAMRGYNADQVDDFLDEMVATVNEYNAQVEDLTAQLAAANAKLDEYKAQEGSVIKTLESARALMNDISASAEKRAEIIVKNAELDADQLIRNAKENVEKLREEEKELAYRVSSIKHRISNLLHAELDRFDAVDQDIFGARLQAPVQATADVASAQAQFESLTRMDMEPVKDDAAAEDAPKEDAAAKAEEAAAPAEEDNDMSKTRVINLEETLEENKEE